MAQTPIFLLSPSHRFVGSWEFSSWVITETKGMNLLVCSALRGTSFSNGERTWLSKNIR